MAHSSDVVALDEKRLRDLESGGMTQPVPAKAGGIGNPAPLGLLCFGMTTGAALPAVLEDSQRFAALLLRYRILLLRLDPHCFDCSYGKHKWTFVARIVACL